MHTTKKKSPPTASFLSKERLLELLQNKETMEEVTLDIFNSTNSSSGTKLRRICKIYNLEEERLKLQNKNKIDFSSIDILKKNDYLVSSNKVRKIILEKALLPYICNWCNQGPIWRGIAMTLDLDHINGNNKDNRLDNLRFLCKNCHSQTDTYMHKNIKAHIKQTYCECGKEISYKTLYCNNCQAAHFPRNMLEVTREFLEDYSSKYSLRELSSRTGYPMYLLCEKMKDFGLVPLHKNSKLLRKATKEELTVIIELFPTKYLMEKIYKCSKGSLFKKLNEFQLIPKEAGFWRRTAGKALFKKNLKEFNSEMGNELTILRGIYSGSL